MPEKTADMDGRGARRRRALTAARPLDRTRVPQIARGVCITRIGVCIGKCTLFPEIRGKRIVIFLKSDNYVRNSCRAMSDFEKI